MKISLKQSTIIGDKLKIDWTKISKREWNYGMNVELEHKDITNGNIAMTAKIALAHIKELPDYYARLKKLEKKGDKFWKKKDKTVILS